MTDALDIARYIICFCNRCGTKITNLKLQKLLFYIQRYSLQTTGHPAFADLIEAWQFGAVVPNVYYRYCGYGSMPIYEDTSNIELHEYDSLIASKKDLFPWDMIEEIQSHGSSWERAYKHGNKTIITIDEIKKYG